MDLLVATRNRGKLNELTAHLSGLPVRLLTLTDAGITEDVEEPGATFAENAIGKAVAYSRLVSDRVARGERRTEGHTLEAEVAQEPRRSAAARPGAHGAAREGAGPQGPPQRATGDLLTLADDSGLIVDALGGEPGVLSARYGGAGLTDEDRCRLLLSGLERIPRERRTARFVCVLALARAGSLIRTFEGTVEGLIAFEPRGANGFGYDPVFHYAPLDRTFAELAAPEKDQVSHRGQALRAFAQYLPALL